MTTEFSGTRPDKAVRPALAPPEFISSDEFSLKTRQEIGLLSRTSETLFFTGETGVGKNVAASYAHFCSRSDRPFVRVDCAAISEELFANALFGHVRGAYTSALSDTRGLIPAAEDGTLFFDEIGDLTLAQQKVLLAFFEEREWCPVGSTRFTTSDARIIASTNKDLRVEEREGRFRKDLYYRVAIHVVRIPPLRERRRDIPPLAESFAKKRERSVTRRASLHLESASYAWPGNVRELRTIVDRAIARASDREINEEDVRTVLDHEREEAVQKDAQGGFAGEVFPVGYANAKHAFEQSYFSELIRKNGGNVSAAAREAHMPRSALYKKLEQHGISH